MSGTGRRRAIAAAIAGLLLVGIGVTAAQGAARRLIGAGGARPRTAVTGLSASASTSAAGASDVVYTTSFTVSSALNGPPSSGQAGYVQLTAPTGTAFDSNFFGGQYYFTIAGVTSQASSVTLAP
ncbi:MAG: hypothetical protein ACYDHH_26970, partial [Solirubrobacteraceae bacterium]